MSDIIEFSLDDSKIVKTNGMDKFTQSKPGEKNRVSIIAFKKVHDIILAQKAREKEAPLTDAEKADYCARIDAKLAEQLKKPVEQLTDVDRLDIKAPRFWLSNTHYKDGVGTIRCLGKYEGSNLVKPELCCEKMGDAEQAVSTIIVSYPIDSNAQVDMDLLRQRKYTNFFIWKMKSRKFKDVESVYADARSESRYVVDIKVTLDDGDTRYQKQKIELGQSAAWAREDMDPEVRNWILDQGLRAHKWIKQNMGYEMTREKLVEKLRDTSGRGSSEVASALPQLNTGYKDMI